MALQKQGINVAFSQGLDTKSDPKQVQLGKMLSLQNTIFQKGGLLQKRNGFGRLTNLPNTLSTFLTTFKNNLTAVGTSVNAYLAGTTNWSQKGNITSLGLTTMPLIRSSFNDTQADIAISSTEFVCVVYNETGAFYYSVLDSVTGQSVVFPTQIVTGIGTVSGAPRVFILGQKFIIVFPVVNGGTNFLQYISLNIENPSSASAPVTLTSTYVPSSAYAYDGVVANNNLYVTWNSAGAIDILYLTATGVISPTINTGGSGGSIVTIGADITTPTSNLYIAFLNASNDGVIVIVTAALTPILPQTILYTNTPTLNIGITAAGGVANVFYEVINSYSYDSSIPTDYINFVTCTQTGVTSPKGTIIRSVGLASKPFLLNNDIYMLVAYQSPNQSSYFLIDQIGQIISKLAYSNGSGYLTKGLPSVTVSGQIATIPYLFDDLAQSVNKTQGLTAPNGVYLQTGINLVNFDFAQNYIEAEIGSNLHLSGGLLWAYDGANVVEQNFNVWPDSIELTPSATGGSLTAQQYFYQVIYDWTDLQGNIHRSAPSIPVSTTTTGTTSSVVVHIPTLRLTYKKNVKIDIYRWSTGQQNYYKVTSIASPVISNTTIDSVNFTDTFADSSIIGNELIYTTGGIVEDIGPPPTKTMTLFKSRLVLVDAEDQNLLWYSKQVIEGTPVEMSDLFTIFVSPTIGSQGSTGVITALAAMDDKLIVFKENAIYYITGNGPDNTGANNDFSDPIFIISTVGCINQNSIVFMPQGLMFQSDKGIWLLGRDLSTSYIGAPVEAYNTSTVLSALNIPATNQVRFTLDTGLTLMYDYYYGQWGTFVGIPAISSTLYKELHTYIDSFGRVFQETPGTYLDGSRPVNMSFTTSWVNLAGLQGFERLYHFLLLGTFISPHKLSLQIAYDYDDSTQQMAIIAPDNFNGYYGDDSVYGGSSPYGGNSNVEQWRVFLDRQKCEALKITLSEMFDPSYDTTAGAGLTLSGLNFVVGIKNTTYKLKPSRSVS